MKLIVGLGNPGARYRGTLHNVGFDVADELARRHGVSFESAPVEALMARIRGFGEGVLVAKPLTFMNLRGPAVGALQRYYRIEPRDTLVVVDDVNLPAGQLRVRGQGSAGGHNGLKSIIQALGSDEFPRLRVGVGRGDPRRDLADHVLAKIEPDIREAVSDATRRAADAAELFVTATLEDVMNRFNARPLAEADTGGDEDAPRGTGKNGRNEGGGNSEPDAR
jgi:PTH1 family peptidyl-tRNA hydrolase